MPQAERQAITKNRFTKHSTKKSLDNASSSRISPIALVVTAVAIATKMTGTYYLIYYPTSHGTLQRGFTTCETTAKKAYELCHVLSLQSWNVQKGSTTNHTAYAQNKASDGGATQLSGGWVTNGGEFFDWI